MKISTIGVVTRDRAATLEAALSSHLEIAHEHGRRLRVILADDSRLASCRDRNRLILRDVAARFGAEAEYVGVDEKARLAEALENRGLEPSVVDFALRGRPRWGPSYGANRNALMLAAAGEPLFCVDDDVYAPAARLPGPAVRGRPEHWFFADQPAAMRAVRPERADVLAPHERALGAGAGDRRVWATISGIVGDCALSAPHYFHSLRSCSRGRLLESGEKQARSRQILRAARAQTRAPSTDFTSIAFGVDNRDVLAPFIPVFRNEDGMFAAVMSKCARGCVVHIPRALRHAPFPARSFSPRDFGGVLEAGSRPVDLMVPCWILPFEPGSSSAEENLRALGRSLAEAGAMSLPDFRALAGERLRRAFCVELLSLRALAQGCDRRSFWGRQVERHLSALERLVDGRRPALPACLGSSPSAAWARWRSLVGDYGRLVAAWPDMRAAARERRGAGVGRAA